MLALKPSNRRSPKIHATRCVIRRNCANLSSFLPLVAIIELLLAFTLLGKPEPDIEFTQAPVQIFAPGVLPAGEGGGCVYLEAVDSGLVATQALLRVQGGIHLEEDGVEGGAEVGTVDGGVAGGFGVVDVFAFGAVELDGALVGEVGLAHGEERMAFAHDARTLAKVAFLVLVKLWCVSKNIQM